MSHLNFSKAFGFTEIFLLKAFSFFHSIFISKPEKYGLDKTVTQLVKSGWKTILTQP